MLSGDVKTTLYNRFGAQTAWYIVDGEGNLSEYCAIELDETTGYPIRTTTWNGAGDFYVEDRYGQSAWYLADGTLLSTSGVVEYRIYADGTREMMVDGVSYEIRDGVVDEVWSLDGPGQGHLWIRREYKYVDYELFITITEYDMDGNVVNVSTLG